MNCRRVEQLLSNDLEGRLPARAAGEVRAHLGACAACRRLRDEMLAAGADLRALAEPVPPADVERRAVVRWITEQAGAPPSWWRRQLSRLAYPPAWRGPLVFPAVVAALFLAVLNLALVRWDRGAETGPTPLKIATGPHASHSTLGTPASHSASGPPMPGSGSLRAPTRGAPLAASSQSTLARESSRADGIRETTGSHPPPFLASQRRAPAMGDLTAINREPGAAARQWEAWSHDELEQIEAIVRRSARVGDDFVQVPFPRLASASDRQIAQAVESYKREAAIVDPRLARAVTLQQKATALSDLCERLRGDTGIALAAGQSVADEKVSVFCEKLPLRDVMRQLSRPFGYTWIRSGKQGEYRYELMQDLRSQLLEEELRNRDRNEALLALEKEIERYRPYLQLSPDEALARAEAAPPAERELLRRLGGVGWGPIQMYFRLSPQELASLRSGQSLVFSRPPKPGHRLLPLDLRQGVLQCQRTWRVARGEDGTLVRGTSNLNDPEAIPLTAAPEVGAIVTVTLEQTEPGRLALSGNSGHFTPPHPSTGRGHILRLPTGDVAVGQRRTARGGSRDGTGTASTRDRDLRARIALPPRPSCRLAVVATGASGASPSEPRVTTGDVLEALHRTTGLPIVSDYYTRLYKPEEVSARGQVLAELLDRLAETMRMRWNKEGRWLQFRSATYYYDRLKEVPNRLLEQWAAARRRQGVLSLDDLVEIARLPDAQLDGTEMAEGAKGCFGLAEWDLLRDGTLRSHVRFLAEFTSQQRQEAMSPAGLSFSRMSLSQQQGFLARTLNTHPDDNKPLRSLDELAGAALRVQYTQPGAYQWQQPDWLGKARWIRELEPGPQGRRVLMPPIRERTREAALQAVRQIRPQADASEIYPTELDLVILYFPGTANTRLIHYIRPGQDINPG